jgi:hypothetical protein
VKSTNVSETYNTPIFRVDFGIVGIRDSNQDSHLPNRNSDVDHPQSKVEILTTHQITALAEGFQARIENLKDIRSNSEEGKNTV